jgi:hypothetical protein
MNQTELVFYYLFFTYANESTNETLTLTDGKTKIFSETALESDMFYKNDEDEMVSK